MSEEEKKAIEYFMNFTRYTKDRALEEYKCQNKNIKYAQDLEKRTNMFEIILNLIQKQQIQINKKDKIIDEIKEYANWHIDCCTEDIADYIDDDRIGNANIIEEFKEQREHWKDILRILNNEKTYIDYKNY